MNDLTGSSGRFDVLARAVNAALFISHGVREDSVIFLHLMGGEGPSRRVVFDGSKLRGVRPDERSIVGQIKSVIREPVPPAGRMVEVSEGISHSGGGLGHTLDEWRRDGLQCYILDADGDSGFTPLDGADIGFVISDDQPFSEKELAVMDGMGGISLGKDWLQGHSCISILHHIMDGG